jgi:hypothetical protein
MNFFYNCSGCVPQAAPASLAEKTRLQLRHSPLRSTATAYGLIDTVNFSLGLGHVVVVGCREGE